MERENINQPAIFLVAGIIKGEAMKYFYYLILLFITISISKAQNDDPYWEYLCSPTGGSIHSHIVDSTGNIYINYQNGLSFSTNQGKYWRDVKYDKYINDMEISKDNKLYIFSSDNSQNGIDCSTDNGNSWHTVTEFGKFEQIGYLKGFAFDKNDRLYIVTGWDDVYISVKYSDDYGISWDSCNTENIIQHYKQLESFGIRKVQIVQDTILTIGGFWYEDNDRGGMICKYDKSNDQFELINTPQSVTNWHFLSENEFFVGTYDNLLYTTDGGATWETIFDKSTYHIFSISDNEYYISNRYDGIHHTTDKGKSWTALNNGLEEAAITQVSMTKDNILIATGYNGFYYSSDKGNSWIESNEGYTSNNIRGMSFDKQGNLYAVDYYHFLKSTDNGETWAKHYFYPERFTCILVTKDNTIIIGSYSSKYNMQISRDGGETWKETEEYTKVKECITQISTGRIFAGGYSLHYSDDDGETWNRPSGSGACYSLAENNEGHVFISGYSGRICRSTDGGTTFEEVQESQITDNPDSGHIIFCKDEPIGLKFKSYYRSSNNGKTWYKPETYVQGACIAMDSLGCIYAIGGALTQSTDGFLTLVPMNKEGLFHDRFNDIEISPDGHIYLAAEYGGLYRSRERYNSVEANSAIEHKVILDSPIPNPTNSETRISFTLPQASKVQLRICDVLGNTVSILSDRYCSEGTHTEIVNTEALPSGIYFLNLYAGGEIITKQMLVMR